MPYSTFSDAQRALKNDEASCEALVSSFLDRIQKRNDELNAFIELDEEGARNHARYLDSQRARGHERPLAGLIVGVKDVLCMRGRKVTCGSQMLSSFESLIDATALKRLRDAGAIFLGKTNCDEFAMGSSNETSYAGPVRHPADPTRVPGGSSGGSAAAVADGMVHAALGTDTGGSVRQPAAFCGVVGLKPTYGRVSRYGLVAYASSFDTIGPMAHSVEDVARLLEAMAGADPNDATSADVPVPSYTDALTGSVEGLRIGLPKEYFAEGLDEEIKEMVYAKVRRLKAAGATVQEVSLPHTDYGIAAYYILTTAEASSNLARFDGVRYGHRADVKETREDLQAEHQQLKKSRDAARANGNTKRAAALQEALDTQERLLDRLYAETRTEGFGAEVKRRIMLGTYVLSSGYYDAYYEKAQRVRTLIRNDFDQAFEAVDVLITPATPTPAFERGSKVDDPLAMYLNDVYTVTANLAGVPGLVVPAGTHSSGLPVGMQLLGRHFDEATLLQVGDVAMDLS